MAQSPTETSNLQLLNHIRLPRLNEIICVDDLNLGKHLPENISSSFISHVTWRYEHRRALIGFVIFPLPFVGDNNESTINDGNPLKCYLEYFNECSKKFVTLKEFVIQEGLQTNVIKKENEVFLGNL